MNNIFSMPGFTPDIKVIGVGGGGSNIIDELGNYGLNVSFAVVNTDSQALVKSTTKNKIPIGEKLTRGRGAGANPEIGYQSMLQDIDRIKEFISDTDMLFVVGGLGGGTGSGAIIPILEQAKKSGILTIAVVTKPFSFEGARRKKVAEQALKFILERADSTIVISNDKLIDMVDKKKTLKESFKTVDRYLASNLKAIISAINEPGVINIDFADVKTTLKDSGMAVLGTGVATGKDRVAKAMENAVNSRVLERDISSARRLLLYITGPDDLGLLEVNKAAEFMRETISPDSAIIFGVKTDEKCDEVSVTFVASDFDG